jgi:hypothetical protein
VLRCVAAVAEQDQVALGGVGLEARAAGLVIVVVGVVVIVVVVVVVVDGSFWLAPTLLVVPARQALQPYLMWPCWQMALPPQSLHRAFLLPCWQMLLPPQSLQLALCRPC